MSKRCWWIAVAAIAGCGHGAEKADLGASDGGAAPDLAGDQQFRYVTDHIALPAVDTDFAADLIGDGQKRNKLGDIVQAFKAQKTDLQAAEDSSIAAGSGLALFSFSTIDPALVADPAAQVAMYAAKMIALPDGGVDVGAPRMFTVDGKPKGVLSGPLAAGVFESDDPLTLTDPPTVYLTIPINTGASVELPVVGARIGFTPTAATLSAGQLNGAIKKTDVSTILVPALAVNFTAIAMRDPCDASCMNTRTNFDSGMCTNPDGSMAVAGDHVIAPCEVTSNLLVKSLLAPDVQLFNAQGMWMPNKANTSPDSLSVGVGFTAVQAIFAE